LAGFGIESGTSKERFMAHARARHGDLRRPGVGSTALEIFKTTIRLIITEGRLLRTELGEKIGILGVGVALAAGGAILLITAVVLLFVAAISALMDHGLSLTVATLIVFGAVLLLGVGCLWFGLRQLQPDNLMPKKTIAQVQKDFQSIVPEAN
jgi:uncharacterized membrane protein YqjE